MFILTKSYAAKLVKHTVLVSMVQQSDTNDPEVMVSDGSYSKIML